MKAVFLDRDGTIIEDMYYLSNPERMRLLKGTVEGLKMLKEAGYELFLVTNQSGVARGFLSLERLKEIHRLLQATFKREGISFRDIQYCPHHPQERCNCRKPQPFMIKRILKKYPQIELEKSFVIGDRDVDILLGKAIGTKTILIRSNNPEFLDTDPDFIADSLLIAADWILKSE